LLIGDLQLLSHAQSTWVANVTALIPSIAREPLKARYRMCGRKLQRGMHLNLLLTLACAIILAHAAPSFAASDETEADKVCAQSHAAGAYCEVWRD
jgi:hypothetical protein